ncbi:MAG: sterol desaturase family protein [Sphingobacteriales bacterium]|nr:MAG: sterol desaturase family protein [Sphingobacteriales bacterium]
MYAFLILIEAILPARKLPEVKNWKVKGILSFIVFFYISVYLPMVLNPLLEPYRLFDLSGIGGAGGVAVGLLLLELAVYFWHRSLHRSNKLWRSFHQMHHSAERLDTYGTFFFSPLDMVGWTVIGSVCFSLLVGLSAEATTIIFMLNSFLNIFQHSNIRTPVWLGYIIQRPESHTYHHAQKIHRHNYCDLPVIDMVFGTFHNPKTYEYETGFYHGASHRMADMLMFRDVSVEE